MSNAKRPAATRTRTPKDEEKREAALNENYTIEVDGNRYTLRPAEINGLVEMKVRRDTAKLFGSVGMGVMEIINRCGESPGMDLIGAFMYAAEVAAGRDADLEAILGSISWGSDFEFVDGDGEPVPQP